MSAVKTIKKRKRRSRVTAPVDDEENKELVRKLKKKSDASRPEKIELPPHAHKKSVTIRGGTESSIETWSVHNPESYHRLVNRIEESQMNKITKPEGKILDGPWKCGLCGLQTSRESLGDLFGPYYQRISEEFWPPFLDKPKKKGRKTSSPVKSDPGETMLSDLWFHGDCILWTPSIFLRGPQLVGIEEHMAEYWGQKCCYCHHGGSSIACSTKGCDKTFHYPCGVSNKSHFNPNTFDAWCSQHAGKARTRQAIIIREPCR